MVANPPNDSPARAMRYMNRYACLGPDCEENCCGSWGIPVDEEHYERARTAMADSEEHRERFEHLFLLEPAGARSQERFATLRLGADKMCPFNNEERLCTLHIEFGEEMIPDACAIYPRIVSEVGDRTELSGAPSCPEIARLLLLAPDATEFVDAAPGAVGRSVTWQRLRGGEDSARRLDLVRDAMYTLLTGNDHDLNSRLFALAHFAHQLDDTVGKRGDPDRLAAEIDPLLASSEVDKIHDLFSTAPPDGGFGLMCVAKLLIGPTRSAGGNHFPELVEEVLKSYKEATSIHDMWAAYKTRRDQLDSSVGERVTELADNYARNFCMNEWYSTSPSLRGHVHMLLLRIATLRFLILGHPTTADLDREGLDRLAIKVFYGLSRAVERSPRIKAAQLDIIDKMLPSFAHAAPLLYV